MSIIVSRVVCRIMVGSWVESFQEPKHQIMTTTRGKQTKLLRRNNIVNLSISVFFQHKLFLAVLTLESLKQVVIFRLVLQLTIDILVNQSNLSDSIPIPSLESRKQLQSGK